MSNNIIDRRLNGKGKSVVNRGRFLDRYKDRIQDAIADSIKGKSIQDINKDGADVKIPKKDISEPYFGHDGSGSWDLVHTGNEKYNTGDRIDRPDRSGGRGRKASNSGEGEDDFIFALTKEEFMKFFFEGLELPNLIKQKLMEIPEYKQKRAGYKTSGPTNTMDVLRSMKSALGRRIALGAKAHKKLHELEKHYDYLTKEMNIDKDDDLVLECLEDIQKLQASLSRIAFIDPIDLRYSNHIPFPQPKTQAVMFMIMDVSGSMGEDEKLIAKQFFILLYLFLTRTYEKIELVFIKHHTEAKECSEQEFFYDRESGGTVVSTALELTYQIIQERYLSGEHNIYIAQASDGDNWNPDSIECRNIINKKILPLVQYFAYIEITEDGRTQNLWDEYEKIALKDDQFQIRIVQDVTDVYPVFRSLFEKDSGE